MSDTDKSMPASASEAANKAPKPSGPSAPGVSGASGRKRGNKAYMLILLLFVAAAAGLGGALYYQYQQYELVREDLARLQGENATLAQNAGKQAAQAMEMVRSQADRLAQLENILELTSNQVHDLDQALQLMTDSGSDLLLLNDIDHLLTIAQQQLALGGKVANAIISLEAAQAQLARANRPALAALQQSINGDIDRLRAVSLVDVSLLSAQLDELSGLIDIAPLLVPDSSVSGQANADNPASGAETKLPSSAGIDTSDWRSMLATSWQWTTDLAGMLATDLRDLVDIRRVDDSAALLMSPEQAKRFREALKQRVVMARMALMMHESRIWSAELSALANALDQRYDMRSDAARKALRLTHELLDAPIEARLPGLDNSLAAIAAARDAAAHDSAASPTDSSSTHETPAVPAPLPAEAAS